MWTCPHCDRIFKKASQPHSCQKIPLDDHFHNKPLARELFDNLFSRITGDIGPCRIVSLPCCVHLFGNYDFLAALPKKDKLEIRFSLNRVLNTPLLTQSVPVSSKYFKNCLTISKTSDINNVVINWITESYHLHE